MTDPIQRLAEGPGSRELSKEVLTALGYAWSRSGYWLNTKASRALYTQGGEIVRSPTESVDDALALVGEGWKIALLTEIGGIAKEPRGFFLRLTRRKKFDLGKAREPWSAESTATGENPLPRAICIAVLKSV